MRRHLHVALFGFVLACLLTAPTWAFATHADPLVAEWHLDSATAGTTPDSSGHGLNGTLSNGATLVPGGRFANALDLPTLGAAGSRVTVPDSPLLEPVAVSVAAWANSATAPGPFKWLFAKGANGCLGASYGFTTGAADGLRFGIQDGVTFQLSPDAGTGIWDGQWHAIAGTYDGSALRLFIDGAQVGAGTPTSDAIAYNFAFEETNIGNYPGSPGPCPPYDYTFPGLIDEVSIYNRALTASEIAKLADPDPPQTTITAGPQDGETLGEIPPDFAFESSEPGSSFECRSFDPGGSAPAFQPCTSPERRENLIGSIAPGEPVVFEVRAIDPAGNADPTPESRRFERSETSGIQPKLSKCDRIEVDVTHGTIEANCRLARIRKGRVPCIHSTTMENASCRFKGKRSGEWLLSTDGRKLALAGQALTRRGKRGGPYVIAAPIGDKKSSPCSGKGSDKPAKAADSTGVVGTTDMGGACTLEVALSSQNALAKYGIRMSNFATREVCSSTGPTHPDARPNGGPVLTRQPTPGVYCWTGEGAALNDVRERDSDNRYIEGSKACHVAWTAPPQNGGREFFAAKRPNTAAYPLPGRVIETSPIVWRPISTVRVAN